MVVQPRYEGKTRTARSLVGKTEGVTRLNHGGSGRAVRAPSGRGLSPRATASQSQRLDHVVTEAEVRGNGCVAYPFDVNVIEYADVPAPPLISAGTARPKAPGAQALEGESVGRDKGRVGTCAKVPSSGVRAAGVSPSPEVRDVEEGSDLDVTLCDNASPVEVITVSGSDEEPVVIGRTHPRRGSVAADDAMGRGPRAKGTVAGYARAPLGQTCPEADEDQEIVSLLPSDAEESCEQVAMCYGTDGSEVLDDVVPPLPKLRVVDSRGVQKGLDGRAILPKPVHMVDRSGRPTPEDEACVVYHLPPASSALNLEQILARPEVLKARLDALGAEEREQFLGLISGETMKSSGTSQVVGRATKPQGGARGGTDGAGLAGSGPAPRAATPPALNESQHPVTVAEGRGREVESRVVPAPASNPPPVVPGGDGRMVSATTVSPWVPVRGPADRSLPTQQEGSYECTMLGVHGGIPRPVPLRRQMSSLPSCGLATRLDGEQGSSMERTVQPAGPPHARSTFWPATSTGVMLQEARGLSPPHEGTHSQGGSVMGQLYGSTVEGHPRMGGAVPLPRGGLQAGMACGSVSLPRIRDLKFSGEARDYLQFKADFWNRIGSKVDNCGTAILYLVNCMPADSDAAHEIRPFERMPNGGGYESAWKALDQKYGSPAALRTSWVTALKGPFRDIVECRRLFKEAAVCLEALEQTGGGADTAALVLAEIRISQMARDTFPHDLKNKFLRYEAQRRKEGGHPTLKGLVELMDVFVEEKGRTDKMRLAPKQTLWSVSEDTKADRRAKKAARKGDARSFAVQAPSSAEQPPKAPGESHQRSRGAGCSACGGLCARLASCNLFKGWSPQTRVPAPQRTLRPLSSLLS